MLKGGYQILDFKGIDLRNDSYIEIKGIYELIEGTRKPILCTNVVIDGTEIHDFFAVPYITGNEITLATPYINPSLSAGNHFLYYIEVADNDICTGGTSSVS